MSNSSFNYVDINTATVNDFANSVNGVGHSKAKAIVRFRTTYGRFNELCQLTEVPGIAQNILDQNEGILQCNAGAQTKTTIDLNQVNRNLCKERLNYSNKDYHDQNDLTEDQLFCDIFEVETPLQDIGRRQASICVETPLTTTSTNDTSIMNFTRNRLRSRNTTNKNSGMSTRSSSSSNDEASPSSSKKLTAKNRLAASSSLDCLLSTPKSLSRNQKTKLNLRSKKNVLSSLPNNETSIDKEMRDLENKNPKKHLRNSTKSPHKHPEKTQTNHGNKILSETSVKLRQIFSPIYRRPSTRNKCCQQMKRKLDQRSDPPKYPEKKPCKSSSWVPSPNAATSTFGEIRAEVTRSVLTLSQSDDEAFESLSHDRSNLEFASSPRTHNVGQDLIKPVIPHLKEWLEMFQNWSSSQGVAALDELIDICEPRQVRHIMEVIEPQFQRDFISLLPKELALYVLSFLDPRSLIRAAQTCRYWHILAEDNLLWREKCAEQGIKEPHYPKALKGSWRNRKYSGECNFRPNPSEWKAGFFRQHNINANWRNGKQNSLMMLKGHDDHVITCLQFNGNRIVSGSDDNTLKVWSAVSGKCIRTLVGHTGGVWCSQMVDNLIISGSTDRSLKIWDVESGVCIHTLYGHTSTVRCMALHDKICVSGSRDATLRIWNIETGACLHVLIGHLAAVRCVCYDGNYVVSGAYDNSVKVWDPVTKACIHTLEGHQNRVYSLQFDGVHIVSGSLDTSIKVWSVETGRCLHTLVGHQSLTSGMELKDNILVSGNADSTVKIWDILTGECLKTLEGPNKHQSAVTCLQFRGKFVITSSDDGTVKLWDAQTGKVIRDLVSLESRGSGGVVWRIRASETKLICAVGSRNGTEETKLLALDFDPEGV